MKVYVMSEDKRHGIWFEAVMASEVWAAMTPIDIPDGCQLAVVKETATYPALNPFTGEQDILELPYFRYVVQVVEVK